MKINQVGQLFLVETTDFFHFEQKTNES